ncbi:universal stress protein [Roseateles violae]|uniref:Universal stress protein n=1 Tax=Roseateles violae TaxID=3058042 RepID=A0ABT8DVI2_9BURK|nr:universal stress protein [Pelomonas sp. PFR6]MDN3922222.1 universal stress protein [Pelomonas sp. PFR6]
MNSVFKHVLVATDGSPMADRAIALALRVGGGAKVTALLVVRDYGLPEYLRAALAHRPDAQALRKEIVAEGHRLLDAAIERAVGGDARIQRRVVLGEQSPSREIVALAEREGCDLIVIASHGLGGRMAGLLGSQSQGVLTLATLPVLVVR